MSLNVELLESSFELVKPHADELVDRFYDRLFRENPQVRPLFPDDMRSQKGHLLTALATIVQSLRTPEKLKSYLQDLGLRHISYGVKSQHYPIVGQTLLATLADVAGNAWTPQLEEAWSAAYDAIQSIIFETLAENGHPVI